MLQALLDQGIEPDVILGTSIGAVNGAVLAAQPGAGGVARLADLWLSSSSSVWRSSPVARARTAARTRTALHTHDALHTLLTKHLGAHRIEDLPVPFQCCAASIERAAEHWFTAGPLVEAVLASCAVPGLFPAVEIDGETYVDGGIVNSIPVGRAVELGATTVYVLQVGRIERPLTAPRTPWDVGLVAFEIARRHRFARDMAAVPDGVAVHLLPSGEDTAPAVTFRYRDTAGTRRRIAQARTATAEYLRTPS